MLRLLTYFFPNTFFKPTIKIGDKEHNVNEELCSLCKGRCCKKSGCHFSPEDFGKITYQSLKKKIDKGWIHIEYIEGKYIDSKKGTYILRVRNKGEGKVGSYSKNGCLYLTDNGCFLNYEDRPTGGKLLIPIVDKDGIGRCYNSYSLLDCCTEWYTYRRILKRLVRYYKRKRKLVL